MSKGFIKGLKPLFIQRLALLIGICYLMNPLQKQIKTIFHTISHAIEMPGSVMSHNSHAINSEIDVHSDHETVVLKHDHKYIDLIDAVLFASNENNDNEDSILIEIKLDKHITAYQFQLFENLKIAELHHFWMLKAKLKNGYLKKLKEPPKYFLS